MDLVFKALADPTRRLLLDRLNQMPGQTVSELIEGIEMRRQSATKHIAILEAAGLVNCEWHGREKRHYLNPLPIAEIGRRWIDKFSSEKAEAILNLKQALEKTDDEQT